MISIESYEHFHEVIANDKPTLIHIGNIGFTICKQYSLRMARYAKEHHPNVRYYEVMMGEEDNDLPFRYEDQDVMLEELNLKATYPIFDWYQNGKLIERVEATTNWHYQNLFEAVDAATATP